MSNTKEKAIELVNKYNKFDFVVINYNKHIEQSKQCALIAVDEILEMYLPILEEDADAFYDYWEEVKQEIEKI